MPVERSLINFIGSSDSMKFVKDSGKRVGNTWVTYLEEEDSPQKGGVIFHGHLISLLLRVTMASVYKLSPLHGLTSYQVVGRVMADKAKAG